MANVRIAKQVNMEEAVKVGDYRLAVSNGQIMVFIHEGNKDTMLKAIDVKHIEDEKEELAEYVEKFKIAYNKRVANGQFV